MPRRPFPVRPARLVIAAVAVATLALAACGGAEDVDQVTFSQELQERTNEGQPVDEPIVPAAVADCLATKVFDEFDQAEINRIYRAATQTELEEDVRAKLTTFNQECFQAELDAAGGGEDVGSGDGEPIPTTAADATTTTEAG